MFDAQKLGCPVDRIQLKVGEVALGGRAFLAPMAGVTDFTMRVIAERHGASATVSEMITGRGILRGDRETTHRIRSDYQRARSAPRAIQIAARDVRDIEIASRHAEASGADWVDINMGCPCKRVTGGMAGAALMRDLDQATSLIVSARRAVKIPITLKLRLGWDASSINAPELARRAEGEGVALITVHGRTRQQFYSGQADWQAIEQVKSVVRIPVVANGDCASIEDARAMLNASGADAVMIGRAAIGRPWLVGDIAHFLTTGIQRESPAIEIRGAIVKEHLQGLISLMGEAGLRHARKHLAAYVEHSFDAADHVICKLKQQLLTTSSMNEAYDLIDQIFLSDYAEVAA